MHALDPKLHQRLCKALGRAIADFSLIEPGDRLMVAVSGGKDSFTLLYLLRELQARAPIPFEVHALHLDQGDVGHPVELLEDYFRREGYAFTIVREDTRSIVRSKVPEGATYCSLCSRLRRGILYSTAKRMGFTKIALGHHRDDAVHTLLLNIFYAGKLASMPAKLHADDGTNIVIRPLIYAAEADIRAFSELVGFPIIPCDLCGSQPNLKRKQVAALLDNMERESPTVRASILAALQNVVPTHLLDRKLAHAEATEDDSEEALVPVRSLLRREPAP